MGDKPLEQQVLEVIGANPGINQLGVASKLEISLALAVELINHLWTSDKITALLHADGSPMTYKPKGAL